MLGDISKEEVAELNRVFHDGYFFTKSPKEPARIFAWRWLEMGSLTAAGWGIALYALMIKRYNILWIVAPFIPFYSFAFYNWARQPNQEITNCYRYILAKRAATCEMEAY